METIEIISLMLGTAWASGINLYAAVLVLGYFNMTGQVALPEELQLLSDPTVMLAAGLMYFVEFFADKIPGVDTGWDAIHTFIRIPAGALLAGGLANGMDVSTTLEFAAFLVGGGIATTTHATKMGSRALINTSPEPFTNWGASIMEDLSVIGAMWAALNHPILFIVALVVFLIFMAWLLPKLWRALKRIAKAIGRFFSGKKDQDEHHETPSSNGRANILQELYHDKENPKS